MDELETVIEGAAKDIRIYELKEEQKKAVYLFVVICVLPAFLWFTPSLGIYM